MVQSVLVPSHIKGYMVLLLKDLAEEILPDLKFLQLLDGSAPYFLLWKGGIWTHNPPEVEVRSRKDDGTDEYHVFYGRMRSRDEYNRAHLMVAGHSPSVGDIKRSLSGTVSELLGTLVVAVKNLNDYQERDRGEAGSTNSFLRILQWLATSPNEDRMKLPWSVIIAVVPDVDEWVVDFKQATLPRFFKVVESD